MPRRLFAPALVLLVLPTAFAFGESPAAPPLAAFDEATLRQAGVRTDAAGLVEILRGFIRTEGDSKKIAALIAQLGSPHFEQREQATAELIAVGRPALEALRQAHKNHADPEVRQRAERCLAAFDRMLDPALSMSIVRRLLYLRAAGSAELLLKLLPDANWEIQDEIFHGLQRVALPDGKLDPALLAALSDKSALRRAAAALTVALVSNGDERLRVRKLLDDRDPEVRLRAAQGLLAVHDESSLSVLIALLNEGTRDISWSAEELLHWVALKNVPKETVGVSSGDARKKVAKAWTAWRKSTAARIDWAQVEAAPRRPGMYFACSKEAVWLMGCDGKRWMWEKELESLLFRPSNKRQESAITPDGRYVVVDNDSNLLMEAGGSRRFWAVSVLHPWSVEILRNGHYLVSTRAENRILELDSTGRTLSETYSGELIERVHSILDKVRIGFDKPRPADFNLDSTANRVRGLKDADPEVRRRSAVFLNFLKPTDPASLDALAVALDDESEAVRTIVTATLGQSGSAAVPFLLRTLKQGTARSHAAAVTALIAIGPAAKPALPVLLAVALSPDEPAALREQALEALGAFAAESTQVAPPLLLMLHDTDQSESLRCAAARSLGRLAAAMKASPEFDELLCDPNLPHDHAVALLLGMAKAKDGEAALTRLLTQGARAKRCLAIQLCDHSDLVKVALPALKQAKKDPDKLISALAKLVIYNIDKRESQSGTPLPPIISTK